MGCGGWSRKKLLKFWARQGVEGCNCLVYIVKAQEENFSAELTWYILSLTQHLLDPHTELRNGMEACVYIHSSTNNSEFWRNQSCLGANLWMARPFRKDLTLWRCLQNCSLPLGPTIMPIIGYHPIRIWRCLKIPHVFRSCQIVVSWDAEPPSTSISNTWCLQIFSDCKICRGVRRPLQTKISSPDIFRWPDLRCDHPKLSLWCLSHPASAYVIPLPPLLYCSPLSTSHYEQPKASSFLHCFM